MDENTSDWCLSCGEPAFGYAPHDDPLYGCVGLLLDVRRTNASVDFGERGRWDVKVDILEPATEQQTAIKPLATAPDDSIPF